ncbi:unnamed protein product, partial [marine sediment metagenome]
MKWMNVVNSQKRIRDIAKEVPLGEVPILLERREDKIADFLEQVKSKKERTDENL